MKHALDVRRFDVRRFDDYDVSAPPVPPHVAAIQPDWGEFDMF